MIKVNVSKSKYIIFWYRKQFSFPNIQLDAENIEVTDNIKFLGIVVDEKLKFKNQVSVISSIISKSIDILYWLDAIVPTEVLKMLFCLLVHPYLKTCNDAWYGSSQLLSNKVFILQNKSIRAIFGLPYNNYTFQFF